MAPDKPLVSMFDGRVQLNQVFRLRLVVEPPDSFVKSDLAYTYEVVTVDELILIESESIK